MDGTSVSTRLWEDYERGKEYQDTVGLTRRIPLLVRFYEGDQWPRATERTKNFPRPVVNFVESICNSKKAAILTTPVRIRYHSDRSDVNVERFNAFSDYMTKEIGLERVYKDAMKDACVKGTYFMHFYWDAEAIGKSGGYTGALRAECIDPLHFFVADPTERDEQKQKWILIVSREDVEAVKASADEGVRDEIVPDEPDARYEHTKEQKSDGTVTVLTRYFRQNGEVFCEKATKTVVFKKPFSIAPDVKKAMRALAGEDAPNNALPDEPTADAPARKRAPLYPIVIGQYKAREGSIYGISEAEGIIPNQREINFSIAMSLLNNQVNAWGKYVVDKGALGDQTITNEPGQVLVDHSGTGSGIRVLAAQPLSSQPMAMVDALSQLTRWSSGATEVMTGEAIGANMSGDAIALLQSQAKQPISDLRDAFWLSVERGSKVLAQFYKLFYEREEYFIDSLGEDGKKQRRGDLFSSSEYEGVDFSVVVEATTGTNSSSAGDIAMLNFLLSHNLIDAVTYINAYPSDAISNKEELLKGVQKAAEGEKAALEAKISEYEAQLAEAAELIAKQNETVSSVVSVINENKNMQVLLASLYAESTQKLSQMSEHVRESDARYAEARSDAELFVSELQKRMTGGGRGVLPHLQNGAQAQSAGGIPHADLPEQAM
jgi:hypothetical protein